MVALHAHILKLHHQIVLNVIHQREIIAIITDILMLTHANVFVIQIMEDHFVLNVFSIVQEVLLLVAALVLAHLIRDGLVLSVPTAIQIYCAITEVMHQILLFVHHVIVTHHGVDQDVLNAISTAMVTEAQLLPLVIIAHVTIRGQELIVLNALHQIFVTEEVR